MPKPPGRHNRNQPLKLRASDADDVAVVSALLQDAVIPVSEMTFESSDQRFVLVAGRFRWEIAPDGRPLNGQETPFERVHTGLRFDNVRAVRTRGIDQRDRGLMLNLLSITYADGVVDLLFAGDSAVRLDVTDLSCHLEDLGDPWPTVFRPSHDDGSA